MLNIDIDQIKGKSLLDDKMQHLCNSEKGRSPQIFTVSYSVTSKNVLLIP